MGLVANLSKIGLLVSFTVGIIYELTGYVYLKVTSLAIGATSLAALSYLVATNKKMGNEAVHYLKLLR